jgi:acetoin utilization deacetylase AcuC-like enzyme
VLELTYSPLYSEGISSKARFPRDRYRLVREALEPAVRAGSIALRHPRPVSVDELVRVHDPAYVAAFLDGRLSEVEQRRIGLRPWTQAFVERALMLTGATLVALEAIAGGADVAGNLAGGTHHAFRDRGGGYCVFNDIALAARGAFDDHGFGRVLVVDLDVHQGDGTAALLADEPRAFTLSFHGRKNFPSRKQVSDRDEAFEDGASDAAYLERLREVLPKVVEDHRPDLVVYQAGVDGLAEDTLGRLALTRAGLAERNRIVFAEARRRGCPVLITMGGGYADPLEASVAAHADVYLEAAGLSAS